MKVYHLILVLTMGALTACSLAAQTPVLSSIEAPYPALQSQVRIAGGTYGPGAVPYGPAGTPLVLTGSNLGASGTVQFVAYKNGTVDPSYTTEATITQWNATMLFLTVPSGATSGLVTVTVEGKTSNGLPFIVTPGAYAGSCPAFPAQTQLQITTASLHNGTAGQSYSATLNATGGTQSYTWSLASGSSLPGGLSLNASTGVISGTPTGAAGPLDLTVEVTDSSNPRLTNEAVLSLTVESPTLTSATIYSYSVPSGGFDGAGNITSFQDSVMGNWTFQFDTLNRLVAGNATTGSYSGQIACWTYDSFGNRTSEAVSPTACNNNPPLMTWATYTTSNTNRMDTDSESNLYGRNPVSDAAGNLTSDGGNTYLYGAEGRICAVQSTPIPGYSRMTGYLYNAEGVRIAKGTIATMSCDPVTSGFQLTESYVLGQGGEELTQLDGNNNWQRTNVYGAGKQLATYDLISDPTNPSPSLVPALHFQLTDPLGTRRMQVSASGQPETDIQSLPYGEQLNSFPDQFAPATADDATPLHFTQHERDTESGNDYFGARYYASLMGRFISPDWSSAPDTVPYANFNDPQSLNLYAYAGNNPLIYGDSNGHVYTLCDQFGQCEKGISDIDFEQREAGARAAGEHWNGGKITLADGSAGGTYVQTDVDLPGDAASNRAAANMIGNGGMGMVNMFMKNMAYTVAGGLAGRAIGWGWEAASDWAVLNSGDTVVYRSVNAAGDVDYVGITNDIVRRGGEHLRDAGREIQAIRGLENLTPADARAVEQALIETHGIGSAGTLTNKINSIASTNPGYARALAQGMRILQSVGYFK